MRAAYRVACPTGRRSWVALSEEQLADALRPVVARVVLPVDLVELELHASRHSQERHGRAMHTSHALYVGISISKSSADVHNPAAIPPRRNVLIFGSPAVRMDNACLVGCYGIVATRLLRQYSNISVDDVMQETYCQALESVTRLQTAPAMPAAWLWTIATRIVARQRRFHRTYDSGDPDTLVCRSPEPWQIVSQAELRDGLRKRLERLDPRRKHLLEGYYVHKNPLYVVADQVGISRSAAKTCLMRTRNSLRRSVRGWRL